MNLIMQCEVTKKVELGRGRSITMEVHRVVITNPFSCKCRNFFLANIIVVNQILKCPNFVKLLVRIIGECALVNLSCAKSTSSQNTPVC